MPERNLDLWREILLEVKKAPFPAEDRPYEGYVQVEKPTSPEVVFNLLLMRDAGFIEGNDVKFGRFRVTNQGFDYLDAVRNPEVWSKTKEAILSTVGSATVDVFKRYAVSIIEKMLASVPV